MKVFPIYNEVEACVSKRDTTKNTIYVGTSKKNPYELAKVITTRKEKEVLKFGNVIEFSVSIDGVILKKMWFKNEEGVAGRYIKTFTKMDKLKSI